MGQQGKYLRRAATGWSHWCPACESTHFYTTEGANHNGAHWSFNGNLDAPSFTPSMNISWGTWAKPEWRDEDGKIEGGRCHYFVTNGQIAYCGDCTHALAGKTVPLPELPLQMRDEYLGTGES